MKALKIALIIVLAAIIAFPFLYMLSLSFFPKSDFNSSIARLFPSRLELGNYLKALRVKNIGNSLLNSIATSVLGTAIKLFTCILGAFALSHYSFKGKRAVAIILASTLFIPQDAILFQNYLTVSRMHLLDTHLGMVLPMCFSASSLLLLTISFSSTDKDYWDAARLDGASDSKYLFRVLMPLNTSIILLTLIQTFISVFNSFLWPLLVTNKENMRTLQIAITMLGFEEEGEYGAEMASIAILSLPFIVMLIIFRNRIEKALSNSIGT